MPLASLRHSRCQSRCQEPSGAAGVSAVRESPGPARLQSEAVACVPRTLPERRLPRTRPRTAPPSELGALGVLLKKGRAGAPELLHSLLSPGSWPGAAVVWESFSKGSLNLGLYDLGLVS